MNRKYFFIFTFLFLQLISCNKSDNGISPIDGKTYPTNINYEWEYNTTYQFDYYDSLGNIKNTEVMNFGNTIVRVAGTNQQLNNYNDLIKFISYDVSSTTNVSTTWYQNNSNGFYAIAYQSAGASQPVIPKVQGNKHLTLDKLSKIGIFPDFNIALKKNSADSVYYYQYPRQVLEYPIEIGQKWNELKTPFYRDRFISKNENINIEGVSYNVFKIESIWNYSNIEFTDYVSLTSGLVKREVISDSLTITGPDSPDGIGFANIKSVSILVRKNF